MIDCLQMHTLMNVWVLLHDFLKDPYHNAKLLLAENYAGGLRSERPVYWPISGSTPKCLGNRLHRKGGP